MPRSIVLILSFAYVCFGAVYLFLGVIDPWLQPTNWFYLPVALMLTGYGVRIIIYGACMTYAAWTFPEQNPCR